MTRLNAVSLMVAACALVLPGKYRVTRTIRTPETVSITYGGTSCPSRCNISGSFTVGSPLAPTQRVFRAHSVQASRMA